MELSNYKDNCRLCLKRHTDFMKNIFTCCVEGYQDTLVQNVFALFKVELSPHKDYPQFLCRRCLTELENILLFKEDLQHNQDFLLGLFRAAYPSYIEKDFHTLHYSKQCGTKLKSIAVDTDPCINLENPSDSEYVRVPVSFLKQFSPQVSLQHLDEVRCLNKKPLETKEEIVQDVSLRPDTKLSVNSCKYCSEVFRSQALVNTHYKEVHKVEKQKNEGNKTSRTTQESSSRKVTIDKNRKVLYPKVVGLPTEQITLPQMDLRNNNTEIKEELHVSPSSQEVDKIISTEPVFQEKQALFLQNFDLIAKQEAALLKMKQKSLQSLPKVICKKQVTKLKKRVGRPLNSKNKLMVKPLSGQGHPKREKEVLCRSMQFLKRYGWRNLQSSSRRGTPISIDKNCLFERITATKSISKRVSPKNSLGSSVLKEKSQLADQKVGGASKMAMRENGCEPRVTEETPIPEKIKRSNSVASFNNQNSSASSFKKVPSSITSNKNNMNCSKKNVEDTENSKLDLVVKSEPRDGDNSKKLAATSSRTFHDNSYVPTKPVTDKKAVIDKRNTYHRLAETNLQRLDSCKDLKQELPYVNLPEDLQVKKELRIKLERESSPVKPNGFHGVIVNDKREQNNVEISEKKPDVSHMWEHNNVAISEKKPIVSHTRNARLADDTEDNKEISRRRGRPKKIVDINSMNYLNYSPAGCSTRNNVILPKRRGRPFKNSVQETLSLNATNNRKILKFNDSLNKTTQPHERFTPVTRKPGRPKKVSSPTSNTACDFTQNSIVPSTPKSTKEHLSTLQDLTERFEKGDNISLRMKLRKTACCESLNSLKYDTQELDENFQIKAEEIDQSLKKDLNSVPINGNLFSYDRMISKVGNVSLRDEDEEVTPEKVVNINLEDDEVQMVVLISDDEEDLDFHNDTDSDINKYNILSQRCGVDLEQQKFKQGFRAAVTNEGDGVVKKEDIYRSQTYLPLSKPKLKESYLSKNNSFKSSTSNRPRFTETTPVKRRGRPPNKFSPATYATNRPKCTAELLNRKFFNNRHVGLIQKQYKSLSTPSSQSQANPCVKELFNEVRKRGRPRKDEYHIVSTEVGKSSLLQKKEQEAS